MAQCMSKVLINQSNNSVTVSIAWPVSRYLVGTTFHGQLDYVYHLLLTTLLLVEQLVGATLSSEQSLMLCFFSHVDTSATPTVLSTSLHLWLAPINAQVHTRCPVLSVTVEVNNGGQWKGKRKGKSKLHQQSGFPHNYYTTVTAVWSESLYAFQSKVQSPSLNYSKKCS